MPYLLPALLSIAALVASAPASGQTLTGRVVRVIDGDTIVVLGPGNAQHEVHLAGIDAPEQGQPYGTRSRDHLLEIVAGKYVVVNRNMRGGHERIVGKVLASGQDMNLTQVRAGMAWHDQRDPTELSPSDQMAYSEAETQARLTGSGLWAEPGPIPPWEWRRRR